MTTNQYRELIYALKGEYPPDEPVTDDDSKTVLGGITQRLSFKPQNIAPLLRCIADVLEFSVGNCQTCPINQKHFGEVFGPDEPDYHVPVADLSFMGSGIPHISDLEE